MQKENRLYRVSLPSGTQATAKVIEALGFDGNKAGYPSTRCSSAPLEKDTFTLGELMTAQILDGLEPEEYPEVLIGVNSFGLTMQRPDARWGMDLAIQLMLHGQERFCPWRPRLIVVSPDPEEGRQPRLPGLVGPEQNTPQRRPMTNRHYLINGRRSIRETNLQRDLSGKTVMIATDFVHARTSLRHILKTLTELGVKRIHGIACWVLRDDYDSVERSFTTPPNPKAKALPGFCPSIFTFLDLALDPTAESSPDAPTSSGEISIYRDAKT